MAKPLFCGRSSISSGVSIVPIYAYKCSACGHAEDVLQKISDPLLTQCPQCGQSTYAKQVTAAGFQLKGSGWYVTDFRGGASASGASGATASGSADTGSSTTAASAPAATPAAAPAPSAT
nr:FmdB family zinc ribbon protein [Pusillimonas minor]